MPRFIISLRRLYSFSRQFHSLNPNPLLNLPPKFNSQSKFNSNSNYLSLISIRSFSIHSPNNNTDDNSERIIYDVNSNSNLNRESELLNLGLADGGPGVGAVNVDHWYDPFVNTLVSVLDVYHDLTGLPWWVVIVSSTLALRAALLPLLVLQLGKMKTFSELYPKLPPPFPPLLSGKSYIKQYLHFTKKRKAIGCPSALWGLACLAVQVPCFLLGVTTIRKMSLDHHIGFDCGGILWFQNLTETPYGVYGPIFPILIAGLHFINVQLSFKLAKSGKMTGILGMLAQWYKVYLNVLTLPLCVVGFCIPQGSLVYWVTNSSATLVQQLALSHPTFREMFGLNDLDAIRRKKTSHAPESKKITEPSTPELTYDPDNEMERKVSVQNFSPDELVPLSVKYLSKGDKDRAITLLRLALKKDPEYSRALVLLGQALMQQSKLTEATEYIERAISKLTQYGHPTEVEDLDHLILASTWAGVCFNRLGKNPVALEHLQRIGEMSEPEDPKAKGHYYDGLLILASNLITVGRKNEAEMYLRRAVAYDYDKYNEYLQQCLEDSDDQQNFSVPKK
ncbi:hypothetical protein ACHQM5_004570 [Ranunculus cassubicifolius]